MVEQHETFARVSCAKKTVRLGPYGPGLHELPDRV